MSDVIPPDPDYVPQNILRDFVPTSYSETKRSILWNGLRSLKRIHANRGWEDWITTLRAFTLLTEEVAAEVGEPDYREADTSKGSRFQHGFLRRWERYEALLGANHKPLSKQERTALRFLVKTPDVLAWYNLLPPPKQRQLTHPNRVINAWKSATRVPEPSKRPTLRDSVVALDEENTSLRAHIAELAAAKARIAELEQQLILAKMWAGKVPKTAAEMVEWKRVAEEVRKAERAFAKARHSKAPAEPDLSALRLGIEPETSDAPTIAALSEELRKTQQRLKSAQTKVRNLNVQLHRKTIYMSKRLHREIIKHLHPDRASTDVKENRRLTELAQEFNAFKIVVRDT